MSLFAVFSAFCASKIISGLVHRGEFYASPSSPPLCLYLLEGSVPELQQFRLGLP